MIAISRTNIESHYVSHDTSRSFHEVKMSKKMSTLRKSTEGELTPKGQFRLASTLETANQQCS